MLLLGLSASAAVPAEVHGTIVNAETGEGLQGVVVQGIGPGGKALCFSSSGAAGAFRLKIRAGVDSVSFRAMGYENLRLPVDADFTRVSLVPTTMLLNEVVVKAPDIFAKGDTLVFNVERYARPEDNAIIDIIKRLPGVKVEDDGTIKYQGKPISKFYLDGNDFLDGRYGLATENISHKDVKSVEVMENHQLIKALEGIEFPEEAGINLKLKDDARSRWVGVAQGAAGVTPFLWDASVFTMRMAKKMQNMFTLRADNTGWDPATQITDHSYADFTMNNEPPVLWPGYISADIISSPIAERRTRDNLSWIANAISSWRHGDATMRLTLNYIGDRLDFSSGVTTDYLSPSIPDFIRHSTMRTQKHELSAQFNTEINRRDYFLKNRFIMKWARNKAVAGISGTMNLTQRINRNAIDLTDNLSLVKRNDRKILTFTSRTSFTYNPDRLTLVAGSPVAERLATTDLRNSSEFQRGWFFGYWKAYVNAGLDLDYHRFRPLISESGASGIASDWKAFVSGLYVSPKLDYNRGRWRMSVSMPLRWSHYTIRGHHDFAEVTPRVYVHRQLTAKSELSASASYRLTPPMPYMFITTPIFSDYRNIFRADEAGGHSHSTDVTASYRYRNPLNALFANVSASFRHSVSPVMANQIFAGDYIISTFADMKSPSDIFSLNSGTSKGLGHGRIVVGADFSASRASSSSMRDNARLSVRNLTLEAKPYFKGSLTAWLSVNYELTYRHSALDVKGSGTSRVNSAIQHLSVTFAPHDRWQFTASAAHFFTRFDSGDTSNLILPDLSAVWRASSRVRLELSARNLLDRREYRYDTYGNLSSSEYFCSIRPRNILATMQLRF